MGYAIGRKVPSGEGVVGGMTNQPRAEVGAGWNFDNSYATRLPELCYTRQDPTPVRSPRMAVFNGKLAESLGLNAQALGGEEGAEVFAGNRVPEGAQPLAQAYAGHQFGYFTMLGDGRAILLGEQIAPGGERFDIQLKGAGRTPYSRGGDGRAALGPMLREYIISEAMHALGIPTTRSLAVVTTGEEVYRETGSLTGAILTRVAASHLRVGTFQYVARWGERADLEKMTAYALQRHYPGVEDSSDNPALALLRSVMARQASLIAKWQLVGFIHGVMNTDNMAISGETIDYGPCAFMDAYDPATVFSSIDRQGRYAYGNQPYIAAWNLARLAEALLPLLHNDEDEAVRMAERELESFNALYQRHWQAGMRAKLGLETAEADDEALMRDLLTMMQQHHADYANTFLALTTGEPEKAAMHGSGEFDRWLERWEARRGHEPGGREASQRLMRSSNPAVIPRNHRVEEALTAAVEQDDFSVMNRLLAALADPYAHTAEQAEYAELPPPSACGYKTFCGT